MTSNSLYRVAVLCAALLVSGTAAAHHGWSWTTGGNIQLTGVIVETRLGYPHGTLVVGVEDERWTVEVGQPWRNERAGLEEADFTPGTEIKVEGEPSAELSDRLLKVERLWIAGRKFELYPERD